MRRIRTTNNHYITVDDNDYDYLSQFSWSYSEKAGARTTPNGEILMHRMIMKAKKGQIIDHINRSRKDNRKSNLRFSNPSSNGSNCKRRTDSTYGTGVSFDKRRNKFFAQIWVNKQKRFLGYFPNAMQARKKYLDYKSQFKLTERGLVT